MLEEFTQKISEAIFVKVGPEKTGEDQIRLLMSIRENLLTVTKRQDEITLVVDRSECIVKYLKEQDIVVPNIGEILAASKVLWEKIMREAPQVQAKISPLMSNTAPRSEQTSLYEAKVIAHRGQNQDLFYSLRVSWFHSTCLMLPTSYTRKSRIIVTRWFMLLKFLRLRMKFETIKVMAEVVDLLKEYRQLWSCIKILKASLIIIVVSRGRSWSLGSLRTPRR